MALPTPDVMIQTQDIQYKRPVFLKDELTMNIKVDEIHESVNVVKFVYKFFNQENKVVAKGHVQIGVFES
jgi:acyl-CoA thioesterase FadM